MLFLFVVDLPGVEFGSGSVRGPQSRGGLRHFVAPTPQSIRGQDGNLDLAELGPDEGCGAGARISDRLSAAPIAFKESHIGIHRAGDRERRRATL